MILQTKHFGPSEKGNNAALELDRQPTELRQVLMVASSPRSGSNMLCRALQVTEGAGVPYEYLHDSTSYMEWRLRWNLPRPTARGAAGMLKRRAFGDPSWWRCYRWNTASMYRYLDRLVEHRTSANGVFALKAHGLHYQQWVSDHGLDPGRWGVPVRWVHLERQDVIAQAVSHAIAIQTNDWLWTERPQPPLEYDPDDLEVRLASILRHRDFWRWFFPANGIRPERLTYEGLVADFEGSVRRVLTMVGASPDSAPPPQTRRQATSVNQQWMDWFGRDRPAVVAAAREASS